jgi:hypothetical protein
VQLHPEETAMASVASGGGGSGGCGGDGPPGGPGGDPIPTKGGLPDQEADEESDLEEFFPDEFVDGRKCLKWRGGCGHPTGYLRKKACRNRGCCLDVEVIYVDAPYISVNVFCLFCQLHDICE